MNPQQTIPAPPPMQDGDRQLLEALKSPVEALIAEHVRADIDKEKTFQLSSARKCESYWRGQQFPKPIFDGGTVVDWGPSGTVNAKDGNKGQYNYYINQVRGDGRKFIAVLGQRSPNVKARPDQEHNESLIRRSRLADNAAQFLRAAWSAEAKHRQLAMSLWKNGTTFGYTSYVTNRDKYGIVEQPIVEFNDRPMGEGTFRCFQCGQITPESQAQTGDCSQCGALLGAEDYTPAPVVPVPEVVDHIEFDNGCVELRLCTIFNVTTPFYAESLEECPWLWYERDVHKGAILAAFPELEGHRMDESDGSGSATSQQATQARDLASSPTGTYVGPRANRWRFSLFWLRPVMYPLVADKVIRAKLVQNFRGGVKVTMVNSRVVRLGEESIDEVWSMCKPETSEYIYADPIVKDFLPIQDVKNDLLNIAVEAWERSIPATVVDPRIFDMKKLREHAGLPGEFIPAIGGVGSRLKESMFQLPVAEPNPMMSQFSADLTEQGRENTGILKPIFGADSGQQTATESESKRTQALMQLNATWNEMRDFWAHTYQNGVKQLVKWAASGVTVNGATLTDEEIADLRELGEGGWHFEAEEAMPMTWSQERTLFWSIIDKGPKAWNLFGVTHPLNAASMQDKFGMKNWKIPQLAARDKVLDEINLLLQGSPLVQQGPMGIDVAPSIPVDEFEDDHQFVVNVVREWSQDAEGRGAKLNNRQGYDNVIAWAKTHLMMATPPPMPGDPAAVGGPPPLPGEPPAQGSSTGVEAPPQDIGLAAPMPQDQPPA